MPSAEPSPIVLTIGHSTRTLEEFIGLIQAHGATRVNARQRFKMLLTMIRG